MKTKSLSLTFLMLLLSACSPFTIVSSSGEQPTPVEETIPANPELKLVAIDHVEIQVGVGSPIPVNIVASGTWPDLCSQIAEVQTKIQDFQIEVTVLASTVVPCRPDNLGSHSALSCHSTLGKWRMVPTPSLSTA